MSWKLNLALIPVRIALLIERIVTASGGITNNETDAVIDEITIEAIVDVYIITVFIFLFCLNVVICTLIQLSFYKKI